MTDWSLDSPELVGSRHSQTPRVREVSNNIWTLVSKGFHSSRNTDEINSQKGMSQFDGISEPSLRPVNAAKLEC